MGKQLASTWTTWEVMGAGWVGVKRGAGTPVGVSGRKQDLPASSQLPSLLSTPDTALGYQSPWENTEVRGNLGRCLESPPWGGCRILAGRLLFLLQRAGGKNDKEEESRKVEHSGGKREEQRGRERAWESAGRGRETAVSFWEEKQKVTVILLIGFNP